jgi:hypothetical protein
MIASANACAVLQKLFGQTGQFFASYRIHQTIKSPVEILYQGETSSPSVLHK